MHGIDRKCMWTLSRFTRWDRGKEVADTAIQILRLTQQLTGSASEIARVVDPDVAGIQLIHVSLIQVSAGRCDLRELFVEPA